jgi:O-antigen/teichoic acid export membrane protein
VSGAIPPAWSGSEAGEATRGSLIRLAAEVLGRALSLLTSFLIAAFLGVESFGVFAVLSGVAVVAAEAADLGLQTTSSRALVAGTLSLRSILRAKLVLTAAVVTTTALVLLDPIRRATEWLPVASPSGLRLALAAGPLLSGLLAYYVLAGWSELLGVVLRARGRRSGEAIVLLALRSAGLVFVALAFRLGTDPRTIAVAQALSAIPPLVLGAVLVRRTSRAISPCPDAAVREVLRTSWPLAINGGLALASLRVELLLLFWWRGPREAGLFAAALKLLESLNGFPSAIAAGAMPALTREAARGSAGDGARARTAVTVALLAVPAAIGLGLRAPGILGLLGPEYTGAAGSLRLLAPAVVLLFLNVVLLHGLVAAGRALWLPRLTAIRLLVAIALAAILVPSWGARGAAAGFLAAEAVLLLLARRATSQAHFDVPLGRPLAAAAWLSIPMALAVGLGGGSGTLTAIAIGASVYAATLMAAFWLGPSLLGFSSRDRAGASRLAVSGGWGGEGGR